ncbi:MAG TPA: helix-turn-helix domain-containing protein [Blastocatellia bacterium]|nr:helix-turn-helix domain-containing protein [Blastocatellia bacterium]
MALNHKVIFGMKLRQYREQAGLSLTDLGVRAKLSTPYLTEIEHGKKYPKAEKIERLAGALGRSYDDLVSIRLDQQLSPLADFLASPLLHTFPYHLFGISPSQVVELMTRQPAEASALVDALLGIAEQYNIGVEHFYRAALRSYQELNENYFPEIERAVDEFTRDAKIKADPTPSYADLRATIEARFGYRLDDKRLSERPRLQHFRSVLVTKKKSPPTLLMNSALNELQKKFVLAREIGYHALALKERAMTSAPERVDSFEQVLNDFKASYFAGALLINRQRLLADVKKFFALDRWHPERFRGFLGKYEVTPEIFMYRLTEVLPQYFGIKLHFLRFNHEGSEYRLVKHLNMSHVLIPGGTGVDEHYCRRWLAIRILDQLRARRANGAASDEPIVDAQLSRFIDTDARYLCIAMARHLTLNPSATSSVSLGFRCDDDFERTVKFASDPRITGLEIDGTCERCRLEPKECRERAAPPLLLQLQRASDEIESELASL